MTTQKQKDLFECTKPCGNCPYRTDAPLQHWDKFEFENLLKNENDEFGAVFKCHKNNGSICVGWLMKQEENHFPSLALRLELSKQRITREYLDKLYSPKPLYNTVRGNGESQLSRSNQGLISKS